MAYCGRAVLTKVIIRIPVIHPIAYFRTADSGTRGCVPLALHTFIFLNTLNELIFQLVVNLTLLSLHCAI